LISGIIFNQELPKLEKAVLLTPPKVRYFLREKMTIIRTLSIFIKPTRHGFPSGCGCRKVLPGMVGSGECVCQCGIIDQVYLPVQFLGGDLTFPRKKNTLIKFRTWDVEICIQQVYENH
jgi:hypothetical protein